MRLEYKPILALKEVPGFSREVIKKLEPYCRERGRLFDVRLAFEEALVNAIKHGNKGRLDKPVFIVIEVDDEAVTIDIKDQGSGFDPEAVPLPTHRENLEKPSGRGVFLIKKLMDRVSYLENGSRLRMFKKLK